MWKPIPNIDGYEVSDSGEVRSWRPKNGRGGLATSPNILTQTKFADSDYVRVGMKNSLTNNHMTRRVHQLVLEAFVGPCPAGHVVMHLNDICNDNRLINLKYGTPKENQADMITKGRNKHCIGENHAKALVTDVMRDCIINLAETKQYYGGLLEVADDLAIPINTVRRVIEYYNFKARKEGNPNFTFTSYRGV